MPSIPTSAISVQPDTWDMATVETMPLPFDASALLLQGQSVTLPTATMTSLANGQVITPAISGTPTVSGNVISVVVVGSALRSGGQYRLVVTFVPTGGTVLAMALIINVVF